ncbi:hypothetical protein EYF80_003798 [Liparis tanakae]|uniref:Uncharacterized protein n=1 Tax=Liparis tanakae TaxID=230148 RepID=A0A4Z2J7R7_9TELE|nr:hypothetical protein EYF80_003798 [Liparis tanakae]
MHAHPDHLTSGQPPLHLKSLSRSCIWIHTQIQSERGDGSALGTSDRNAEDGRLAQAPQHPTAVLQQLPENRDASWLGSFSQARSVGVNVTPAAVALPFMASTLAISSGRLMARPGASSSESSFGG